MRSDEDTGAHRHLDIPKSNREIALHLRSLRQDLKKINNRLDTLENTLQKRRFRTQDVVVGGLLFPVLGGILIYLVTKGLG